MIYTSYFANYKGENGVSIARITPKWFKGDTCIDLAPEWTLVNAIKNGTISEEEYIKSYKIMLKGLDVDYYAKLLQGKVLLCYERPDAFCHRKIVRSWFNHYGYKVGELLYCKDETHTCIMCRHSKSLEGEYVCNNTGEILTKKRLLTMSCEDWRYFA